MQAFYFLIKNVWERRFPGVPSYRLGISPRIAAILQLSSPMTSVRPASLFSMRTNKNQLSTIGKPKSLIKPHTSEISSLCFLWPGQLLFHYFLGEAGNRLQVSSFLPVPKCDSIALYITLFSSFCPYVAQKKLRPFRKPQEFAQQGLLLPMNGRLGKLRSNPAKS